MKEKVTIIMRSKNSDWVIGQALHSLYCQNYTNFELLVVDSGSTDRTLELVRQYPCRLIEIEAKSYYPGIVLNMAMEECHTDIVVFQNSDSVPLCADSLGRLVAAFDDPEVVAALGRQIIRPEAVPWVRRDYAVSFPDGPEVPPWITLSLPLAAMRKSVWEKHRFYTDAWASEDSEWGHWAIKNGLKIKYVPDAITMHSHNYTLKQIYGRKFVEGEADAFITGKSYGLFHFIKQFTGSVINDVVPHLRDSDFTGLMQMPVRRLVYNWAYLKGRQLGWHRIQTGDTDTSKGQETVLTRYE